MVQENESPVAKEPLALFTFGYWGWGNATAELVQGVDAAEAGRGFAPPMFVDIRIQRTGRAVGFKGDNFAKHLGPSRYRWMKSLGNRSVATKTGPRVEIDNPAAAEELLDLALRLAEGKQRILFFCACRYIRLDGQMNCHRDVVADLVLDAARQRGLSVRVVEWPGGEPANLELELSPEVWNAFWSGRKTIPLDDSASLEELVALPWCSIVTLRCEDNSLPVFAGPARFEKEWVLPVVGLPEEYKAKLPEIKREAQRLRRYFGAETRDS